MMDRGMSPTEIDILRKRHVKCDGKHSNVVPSHPPYREHCNMNDGREIEETGQLWPCDIARLIVVIDTWGDAYSALYDQAWQDSKW